MATDSNGKQYTPGKCFECKAGEHEDEDDEIKLCVVSLEGEKTRRGNLCRHHRMILMDDGYTVKAV